MKKGDIEISVKLSQSDYELVKRGRSYLEQELSAKHNKNVKLTCEYFLHWAICAEVDRLEKLPTFEVN